MKRKHTWIAVLGLGVLLTGMLATPALAEPIVWSIDLDSGTIIGAANSSTWIKGAPFPIGKALYGPMYFAAVVTDTGAGNGALTDSLVFGIQHFVVSETVTPLWADSAWLTVIALPAFDPTKAWGKQQWFASDSIADGTYELSGQNRYVIYKGGGQTSDTLNTDCTIKLLFEMQGRD